MVVYEFEIVPSDTNAVVADGNRLTAGMSVKTFYMEFTRRK
jgi:hypothetical protein